jgi:scyllo-inositol 2-dehydrogenase (NADP+)
MGAEKIRIAVSGLGRIGWPFHCPQIAQHPEFEFVAVHDTEPSRRKEAESTYGVRSFEDFGAMVAGSALDAVVIATPTHLHRAMAVEALSAGCHVILEKPMAPTAADAEAIVRAAKKRGRILTVYQPRRAEAYFQHLRAVLASGVIGEPYHVRIGMFQFTIRNDWQSLRRFGGGMLNNYGAHALDQLLQIIGYDVKRLFCSLRIVASVGDAEDVVKVVVETKGGVIGEVDINQATPVVPYFFEVYGNRGSLRILPEDYEHLVLRSVQVDNARAPSLDASLASADRRYPEGTLPVREEVIAVDPDRAIDFYADFARAVRTGSAPFVKPEEPLALMKLIGRCREQAGTIQKSPLIAASS